MLQQGNGSHMDKETIQQIAAQVVDNLPLALLMIINLIIVVLVSALTALGVSYFRTRGQHLATKHDFDELLRQLRANTEAVEAIKSEVSQRDWARREWTNLRRVKLEALLEKTHECDLYLDQQRDSAIDGTPATPARDCISELDMLADLYFPELKSEVYRFVINCREQLGLMNKLRVAVLKAGNDPTARQSAYDNFWSQWTHSAEFRAAQYALTQAARSLLGRIMNVDA